MALPFPTFVSSPDRPSPARLADQIVGHYIWLARWSDEIGKDSDLDLKKLAQLAFQHCRNFAALVPVTISPGLLVAMRRRFEQEGIEWTGPDMATELLALRDQSAALFAFVRDNAPQARNFASRTYNAQGAEIERPTKVQKIAAVSAEVAKLRSLFG